MATLLALWGDPVSSLKKKSVRVDFLKDKINNLYSRVLKSMVFAPIPGKRIQQSKNGS